MSCFGKKERKIIIENCNNYDICYLSKKHDTNKYTRSVYMKITQKNYPKIIEQIQKFIGFGTFL